MKNILRLLAFAVLCSSLVAALPARAERTDFDGEHHWKHHEREDDGRWSHDRWRMRDEDRLYVHDWALRDHDRFCRLHGCHHAVYYAPGAYLPEGVYYEPLPSAILAAPSGYVYVQASSGVYLMDRNTRLIVDSVNLLNDLR